jgi:divalent metal cation (Fe/Co/Zn/Cd) transporter
MSLGETLVRWAIIIGFGLLAGVTALAGALLINTGQPGNPTLLFCVAVASAAVALWSHRTMRRLRDQGQKEY